MKRISLVVLVLFVCLLSLAWSQQTTGKWTNDWTEFHRPNMQRSNSCEKVLGVNNVGSLSLKWSYNIGTNNNCPCYTTSSPAVANGLVYIGSLDNNVYAFDAGTGTKLWSYTTDGPMESSPAVANAVVYVGSDDHHIYALDASTGAKLWSSTAGNRVVSPPTVANGVILHRLK